MFKSQQGCVSCSLQRQQVPPVQKSAVRTRLRQPHTLVASYLTPGCEYRNVGNEGENQLLVPRQQATYRTACRMERWG